MNIEDIRDYCLEKPGVSESFPFDESTLVFKVINKGFLFCGLTREIPSINLKCDPEKAIELREEFESVKPGYHMNKKHWNTVEMIGEISDNKIKSLIDDSYDLVVAGLPRKIKEELKK